MKPLRVSVDAALNTVAGYVKRHPDEAASKAILAIFTEVANDPVSGDDTKEQMHNLIVYGNHPPRLEQLKKARQT